MESPNDPISMKKREFAINHKKTPLPPILTDESYQTSKGENAY